MFEGDSADALAGKFPLHASLVLRHSHIIILFNKIVDTVLSKVNWICDYCALIKQTLIYQNFGAASRPLFQSSSFSKSRHTYKYTYIQTGQAFNTDFYSCQWWSTLCPLPTWWEMIPKPIRSHFEFGHKKTTQRYIRHRQLHKEDLPFSALLSTGWHRPCSKH